MLSSYLRRRGSTMRLLLLSFGIGCAGVGKGVLVLVRTQQYVEIEEVSQEQVDKQTGSDSKPRSPEFVRSL